MSQIPETVMNERCAGCALRPGTDAANSWWTQAMFKLCVLTGEAFECHGLGAGHLCKGFVDAFQANMKSGHYDRLPAWKDKLYRNLIGVLHDYAEANKAGKEFDDMAALREAVKNLDAEMVGA